MFHVVTIYENVVRCSKLAKTCNLKVKYQQVAKTYGPDASAEKAARQDSSYIGTRKCFGISISGMSVYLGAKKDQIKVP